MNAPAFLRIDDLVCRFGGVVAIDGVSTSVQEGEVVGILGPNGSGKSTLFNLITGIYKPVRGTIKLRGTELTRLEPNEIARLGILRTFQNPRVFGRLDALQHAVVGQTGVKSEITLRRLLRELGSSWEQEEGPAERTLSRIFGSDRPAGAADSQPYGLKRLFEVARCLAAAPRLLLLDEPTAGLNASEATQLRDLLAGIAREDGLTLLVIDHDVSFLRALCGRIIVIDRGRCIADDIPATVLADARVFDAYFGATR